MNKELDKYSIEELEAAISNKKLKKVKYNNNQRER